MTHSSSRPVLVATDLGEPADVAIARADERARNSDARLLVCHVLPTLAGINPLFPQLHATQLIDSVALRRDVSDALVDRVRCITGRSPEEFELVLVEGDPATAIVGAAEQHEAGLIVVGTHGRGGLVRVLLGSVAEKVVRYAHCGVLIARPSPDVGPILAATDFSDPALPAIAAGVAEARAVDRPLVLMHVVDVPGSTWTYASQLFGGGYVIPLATIRDIEGSAKSLLTDALRTASFAGHTVVARGHAATEIVAEGERRNARLIVVGTRGRTGLRRVALGSVAEGVVRAASSSVLVVRLAA